MRRGVRVTAHKGHAWQRNAEFRPDDMHDALACIRHIKIGDAILAHVALECGDGLAQRRVYHVEHTPPLCCWYIVIEYSKGRLRLAHRAPGRLQTGEGLRRRHLMHQVAVNVKHG